MLGYSASVAGLYVLPKVASVSFGSVMSGVYMSRTGEYKKLITIASIASMASMIGYSTWTPQTSYPVQFLSLFADGLSLGIIITACLIAMHSCVKQSGNYNRCNSIVKKKTWLTVTTLICI